MGVANLELLANKKAAILEPTIFGLKVKKKVSQTLSEWCVYEYKKSSFDEPAEKFIISRFFADVRETVLPRVREMFASNPTKVIPKSSFCFCVAPSVHFVYGAENDFQQWAAGSRV